jgi:hypothetical protein
MHAHTPVLYQGFCIHILNADPDLATQIVADPYGSGSEPLYCMLESCFRYIHKLGLWAKGAAVK